MKTNRRRFLQSAVLAIAASIARIPLPVPRKARSGAVRALEEFCVMIGRSHPLPFPLGITSGAVRRRIEELEAESPNIGREQLFKQAVMEEAEQEQ